MPTSPRPAIQAGLERLIGIFSFSIAIGAIAVAVCAQAGSRGAGHSLEGYWEIGGAGGLAGATGGNGGAEAVTATDGADPADAAAGSEPPLTETADVVEGEAR